jgi:hypothetical protein
MLNYCEYDDDMRLYQKIFQPNKLETNQEFMVGYCILFSCLFFTIVLMHYAYNYIFSGKKHMINLV